MSVFVLGIYDVSCYGLPPFDDYMYLDSMTTVMRSVDFDIYSDGCGSEIFTHILGWDHMSSGSVYYSSSKSEAFSHRRLRVSQIVV